MEFLEANYMWIMIIIVILVMTLIGYIADKSNLLKNNDKKIIKRMTEKNF